jgi:hypothetical protein
MSMNNAENKPLNRYNKLNKYLKVAQFKKKSKNSKERLFFYRRLPKHIKVSKIMLLILKI